MLAWLALINPIIEWRVFEDMNWNKPISNIQDQSSPSDMGGLGFMDAFIIFFQ